MQRNRASAGLGRSIKVVGKGSKLTEGYLPEQEPLVDPIPFEELNSGSAEVELLTSCEKPLISLLTPIEPISAMNQDGPNISSIAHEDEVDSSIWEESILADLNEDDGGCYQLFPNLLKLKP